MNRILCAQASDVRVCECDWESHILYDARHVAMTGPVSRNTRNYSTQAELYPPYLYKQQGVVLIVVLVFFHLLWPFSSVRVHLFIHGGARPPAAYVNHRSI